MVHASMMSPFAEYQILYIILQVGLAGLGGVVILSNVDPQSRSLCANTNLFRHAYIRQAHLCSEDT